MTQYQICPLEDSIDSSGWRLLPGEALRQPQITAAWDALNRSCNQASPVLDTKMVVPLLAHFGDATVRLAILDGDEGPEAAMLVRRRRPGDWEVFTPGQACVGSAIVSASEVSMALRGMNQTGLPSWNRATDGDEGG